MLVWFLSASAFASASEIVYTLSSEQMGGIVKQLAHNYTLLGV